MYRLIVIYIPTGEVLKWDKYSFSEEREAAII